MLPFLFISYELYRNDDWRKLPARLPRILPFVANVGAGFAVQFSVALKAGVVAQTGDLSVAARFGGIIRTVNKMLGTLLAPQGISYDYDLPWPVSFPPFMEWLLPLGMVAGLLFLLITRRYRLLLLFVIVLLPLAPYLNIIPLGHTVNGQMVYYDHYLLFTLFLVPLILSSLFDRLTDGAWRASFVWITMIAIFYAGYSYHLYGFWQTRESLYRRIVEISPGLSKGYFFLGRTYLEQERYPQAIQMLNRVFTTRNWLPEFIDTFQMLGDAYAFSGNYRKGIENYRKHLQHKPRDLKSLQNLSTALIMAEDYREATAATNDLLAKYPGDGVGLRNLQLIKDKK
jgi:tetratricopeptide (TPR) repeat protein